MAKQESDQKHGHLKPLKQFLKLLSLSASFSFVSNWLDVTIINVFKVLTGKSVNSVAIYAVVSSHARPAFYQFEWGAHWPSSTIDTTSKLIGSFCWRVGFYRENLFMLRLMAGLLINNVSDLFWGRWHFLNTEAVFETVPNSLCCVLHWGSAFCRGVWKPRVKFLVHCNNPTVQPIRHGITIIHHVSCFVWRSGEFSAPPPLPDWQTVASDNESYSVCWSVNVYICKVFNCLHIINIVNSTHVLSSVISCSEEK